MIEKMRKYTFILHYTEYPEFLKELQNLGMVHIIRSTTDKTEKLIQTKQDIEAYANDIKFMKKWVNDSSVKMQTSLLPIQMKAQIDQAHLDRDRLKHIYAILAKDIKELEPWGNFSYDMVEQLEVNELQLDLFICSKTHFKEEWKEQYTLTIVNELSNLVYFAVVHKINEPVLIEADSFKIPPRTLADLQKHELEISQELADIDEFYKSNALASIELFETEIERLSHDYDFEEANLQTIAEADNNVMIMQGWIPKRIEQDLVAFLDKQSVVYFAIDGKLEDNPPILLRNNWFAKIFEPISNMFMLPYYNEFDMTPFLAPFYMMFFGFCSGDAGYGIILFLLGWFLKKKAKNESAKPFLTLIQFLGIGTVIMGFLMGSFFSFDLKKIAFIDPYIPIRDTNMIFNFALLLGLIQILTGKLINAIKQIIQSGFVHGLATIGMFIFILSLGITGSTMLGAKPAAIHKFTPYGMYTGLALILLLNTPGKSIIFNIANGIWIMYGVITGFFGDILSYIRLFALGVSGGILGFVINTMAAQFGAVPIIGPILFIVFMIAGHSLNIALSSLGAFVHPMRLTFVEFFNNSGFSGPGIAYKPFGKKIIS